MQEAKSTTTGQTVTAWEFSQRAQSAIDAERRNFVCTECNGPAHYRKASRRGHAALFAAHHADNCGLATVGDDPWGPEGDEVVQRWEADRQRIVVALQSDADAPAVGGNGTARTRTGGGRFVGGAAPATSRIERGPKKLLNLLVHSNFAGSSVEMVRPDGSVMPASSFFVHFDAATPERHVGDFRGFWGIATAASRWRQAEVIYINTAPGRDPNRFRIAIDGTMLTRVMPRFGIQSITEFAGKHVLVFGTARVTNSGRFTLDLAQSTHIAILAPTP